MPHTGLIKQNGKEFKPMGLLSKAKKAADAAKRAAAIAKKAAAAAKKETGKHVDDLVGKPKRNAEGIKKIKPVQKSNTNSRSTLRKGIVGGAAVGAAGVGVAMSGTSKNEKAQANTIADLKKDIASMKAALRKARTETEEEKLKARIEKAMTKLAAAELKAEKNKPIDKRIPGVKKSLRPKLRPKNLKDGGMPMVMKDGKSVPAYAADGVGKMNKGGMTMKKPAKKMMAGGMAKKKPAAKKMMAGGMAKKKMMGGGMAKSTGYMYGGMAKKTKAKK